MGRNKRYVVSSLCLVFVRSLFGLCLIIVKKRLNIALAGRYVIGNEKFINFASSQDQGSEILGVYGFDSIGL